MNQIRGSDRPKYKIVYDMLKQDEAVIVFPEGVRGTGKGFAKRYQLQRFGSGFMHIAIDTSTPYYSCRVSWAVKKHYRCLVMPKGWHKRFGLPYVPIAPPFAIPAKVTLNFW
jgi:1-acyl-sn-glycerol-3-phosphate acyltransferase